MVKAIDNGRSTLESMSPLSLNLTAYEAMTVPEQIFVITNLERTDRGLAPVAGLTTQLDNVAQTRGGRQRRSSLCRRPPSPVAPRSMSWGSIWAGGTANPLGSDYYFMYDDGTNSPNGDCTDPVGCGLLGTP